MTDEHYSPRPLARWYWLGAIAAFLFMIVACCGFVIDVTTNPMSLPLDQRAVMMARPMWMVAAYGIAVWVGLAGALMLLLRRRIAQWLILVSLVAAIVTFLPYAVVPQVSDNITTNDIAAAIVVVAITWTIFWFARHSSQRGWLR
jgi:hypothetical protein